MVFLSARPVRGATRLWQMMREMINCFYPHAPCGARRALPAPLEPLGLFLSARPVRGATPHEFKAVH
mgnify:CR=1 FL=1